MSTTRLLLGGAVLSLLIGGMAVFKRPASDPVSAQAPSALTARNTKTAQQPPTDPKPQPIAAASQLLSITISSCNGELGDANFRSSPSMAVSAIAGVIESGQSVYLTGRIVQSDGEVWHEVTFPGASRDPGRESATDQTGWIAGCFVR